MNIISNDLMISFHPVTMGELFRSAKHATWRERAILFLYPWNDIIHNIIMWGLLFFVFFTGMFIAVNIESPQLSVGVLILTLFNFVTLYILQVTSALNHQLIERSQKIKQEIFQKLKNTADEYNNRFVNKLKAATGRDVKIDPISMASAVLDVSDSVRSQSSQLKNPLKDLLNGTLDPRDIMDPPPDEDNNLLE